MAKHLIFFHGGGSQEDYEADSKLVASLQLHLGSDYSIHYPFMPDDGTPDLGRRKQLRHEILASPDDVVLVGHSLGASMLLACLSEMNITRRIAGVFLIAAPFWRGNEDWVKAFKLQPDFAHQLNKETPIYFYHCKDDDEVPFDHLDIYKDHLPWAIFREMVVGGHQFNDDLSIVAHDITSTADSKQGAAEKAKLD